MLQVIGRVNTLRIDPPRLAVHTFTASLQNIENVPPLQTDSKVM